MTTGSVLRALIIEDSEADAAILLHELRQSATPLVHDVVDSGAALRQALEHTTWDIVLSDYEMPGFSGSEALKIVREHDADIPFIIVSGSIGEEAAVELIRAGAQDYFAKGKLVRLRPAIDRALREAEERRQRRRVEAQLHHSEERFAKIFSASPVAISVITLADARFIDVNPRYVELLGYSPDELIGRTVGDMGIQVDMQEREARIAVLQAMGTMHNVEVRLRTKSGAILETLISQELIDMSGETCIVTMIYDITERKRGEEAIRESERFAHSTVDALSAHVAILDERGVIIAVNKAWRDFGTANSPAPGAASEHQNYLDVCDRAVGIGADDAAAVAAGIRLVMQRQQDEFTYQYACHSQTERRWFNLRVTRFHGEGPVRIVVAHENITESKLADYELVALYNASSFLFKADSLLGLGQQIVEAVAREFGHKHSGVLLRDLTEGTISTLAKAGKYEAALTNDHPQTGLAVQVMLSGTMLYLPEREPVPGITPVRSQLIIPLRTAKAVLGVLDLQSADPHHFSERECRVMSAFAERVAAAIETMQLYEEINHYAGELEWSVARRTAELFLAKEHVEAILNNSSDAIVLANLSGEIERTNPAFNQLFDYHEPLTSSEMLLSFLEPDQIGTLKDALALVTKHFRSERVELVCHRRDGTLFDADVAIAPVMEYDSEEFTVIYSFRDITERKQAEENLRRALEKEKELSELKSRFVSMVSHEFRNPLAVIQSAGDLLKHYRNRMTTEHADEQLDEIHLQIKRLVGLLDDILAISKAETVGIRLNVVPLDLERLCRETIREIQLTAPSHLITLAVAGEPQTSLMDAKLMQQAISNLLSNAVKYSPDAALVETSLTFNTTSITITVKDHGIGIPGDDMQRLFEVFHRARNVGGISGTGLGLAIVKRAVEAHGGTISVDSRVGEGTTFTITIPLNEPTAFYDGGSNARRA